MTYDPTTDGTDPDAEENGVWTKDVRPGFDVLVRRIGSDAHGVAVENARKPYKSFYLSGREPPPAIGEKVTLDIIARGLWLDWKGPSQPYTPELGKQYLIADPSLRRDILFLASTDEAFRREAIKAAEGNSEPQPAGVPSTGT